MTVKIMLVEDDQPILEMMEIMLRRIGYEPVLVPDAMEALNLVRISPPALVLLDVMMTPVDGWEFLEKLRGEFRMTDLPVILFTAAPLIDEKMQALQDHRLGVLLKPVSLPELKAGIEKFLSP
jgi:DNA-binding response OmpR family regulator